MAQGREQEELWESQKHSQPLSRWALSYNVQFHIAGRCLHLGLVAT